MEDVYLKKIELLKNELHNTRRRLYITDRFLNKIGDLAGIQDYEPLKPKNGQSVEEYIAGALAETFREKFITPEVQSAIDRDKAKNVIIDEFVSKGETHERFQCPKCKNGLDYCREKFCPNCGQRMDWGK